MNESHLTFSDSEKNTHILACKAQPAEYYKQVQKIDGEKKDHCPVLPLFTEKWCYLNYFPWTKWANFPLLCENHHHRSSSSRAIQVSAALEKKYHTKINKIQSKAFSSQLRNLWISILRCVYLQKLDEYIYSVLLRNSRTSLSMNFNYDTLTGVNWTMCLVC